MNKLFIPIILGTAREGRQSEKVAGLVFAELSKRTDIETELVDVKDYLSGRTSRTAPEKWKAIAERADAFLIVSPEYNHSFPGELKIFIDSLDKEYRGKAIGIAGVSSGPVGGGRMADHLLVVLVNLGMIPLPKPLLFPMIEKLFDSEGKITDESYNKRISEFTDSLVKLAGKLKAGN